MLDDGRVRTSGLIKPDDRPWDAQLRPPGDGFVSEPRRGGHTAGPGATHRSGSWQLERRGQSGGYQFRSPG